MKITVYVVSTCVPANGEKPCIPSAFGTEVEAEAYAEEMLKAEWESSAMDDEETGQPLPYPGNWQDANAQIAASYSDGSWGEWSLTSHEIEIGRETFDEVFNAAVETAIERRMNEDLGGILEEHQNKLMRRLVEPMVAALRNASSVIGLMDDQISQMEGMFKDEDGRIAEARLEGDEACKAIATVLSHLAASEPMASPEIYITMEDGLIQEVNSTGSLIGATYTVIDFDTDGATDDETDAIVGGERVCIGGGEIGEWVQTIHYPSENAA